MSDLPLWIPNPKHRWLRIANPRAEEELYFNKKYNPDQAIGLGVEMKCAYTSCEAFPQTVCAGCQEYVCENHLYRHPNCEVGR